MGIWISGTSPDESVSKVGSQGTVNAVTDALRREFSGLVGNTSEF